MKRVAKGLKVALNRNTPAIRLEYDEPIYRVVIEVLIGGNIEALMDYFTSRGLSFNMPVGSRIPVVGNFVKLYQPCDGTVAARVIWLSDWTGKRDNFMTLHHEVVHLTFSVMRDRGVELCKESEEAYTYYIEAVFETIVRGIERAYAKLKATKNRHGKKRRQRKG